MSGKIKQLNILSTFLPMYLLHTINQQTIENQKYLTFSDDRTFPNINCGESREHRDIPEDDITNFQHVRGGENTLISKVFF